MVSERSRQQARQTGIVFQDRALNGGANSGNQGFRRLAKAAAYVRALGRQNFTYVEPNLTFVGLFAAISFMAYWFVWAVLFPQPFESLTLRSFGATLCLALALRNRWPEPLRRYTRAYYLFVCLYSVPFFFTYMMLMNGASFIWLLSVLSAIFFLILLVDWFHLLVLYVLGSAAALGTFALTMPDGMKTEFYFEYFPVLVFLVLGGMVFNYKAGMIRQERMRAVTATANSLSKELRPPLQMIKRGSVSLRHFLPQLIDAYDKAQQAKLNVTTLDANHLKAVGDVPDQIETEIEHTLAVVSMMQMNAGEYPLHDIELSPCSISHCIDEALRRYPFKSDRERARITWRKDRDFMFLGSVNLMTHVLLNLTKNALHAVSMKGTGKVFFEVAVTDTSNVVRIRDQGAGLPRQTAARLFDPYGAHTAESEGAGSGIRFCAAVIERFNGAIAAHSEPGEFTEVVITLPSMPVDDGT